MSSDPEIRADVPDEACVVSNGLIDAAVENILTNAVEHNDIHPDVTPLCATARDR